MLKLLKIFKRNKLILEENINKGYYTLKEALYKSKIIITQYITIIASFIQLYGNDLLVAFNDNSSQLQSLIDAKMFSVVSFACGILTIYLRITSNKQIKKDE